MSDQSIEERISGIAERAAAERGVELVHVELGRASGRGETIVRIFIDKPVGVTHEDCSEVSRYVGTVLDVEDFLPFAYVLEVSSPGLERGLYKLTDYERFANRMARIKTSMPVGNQRNFAGRIIGVEASSITFDDKTNGHVRIPFDSVVKANLEIDTEEEFRYAESRARAKGESNGE